MTPTIIPSFVKKSGQSAIIAAIILTAGLGTPQTSEAQQSRTNNSSKSISRQDAANILKESKILFDNEDYAEVIKKLEPIAALPGNTLAPEMKIDIYDSLGYSYYSQGMDQKAIEQYSALLNAPRTKDEDKCRALIMRASCYQRGGQKEEALKNYTTLINNKKFSADWRERGLLNRGILYERMNKEKEAFADYQELINSKRTESDTKAMTYRLCAEMSLKHKNYDEAIAHCSNGLKLNGVTDLQKTILFMTRGEAYEKSGNTKNALGDYNSALKPSNTWSHLRAKVYIDRLALNATEMNAEEIIKDCTAILNLNNPPAAPGYQEQALLRRAKEYARQGRNAEAIADYSKVTDSEEAKSALEELTKKK